MHRFSTRPGPLYGAGGRKGRRRTFWGLDPAVGEQALHEFQQEHSLGKALDQLSPRCRKLVQMLFFEVPARPYEQVAQSLGLKTGSIGFIRGRCLEKMRGFLDQAGFSRES